MNALSTSSSARVVRERDLHTSASARCAAYGLLSSLVASPHDLDSRTACEERHGLFQLMPYGLDADALLDQFQAMQLAELKTAYSQLFEVGSKGPPVPIREDLQTGQKAGTREDLVRFYDFFGYELSDKFAWAPDHLSVELEFMHFLCFRESEGGERALSYQLAQADFAERHLINWVPSLAESLQEAAADSIYFRIVDFLCRFLEADLAWQRGTIHRSDNEEVNGG